MRRSSRLAAKRGEEVALLPPLAPTQHRRRRRQRSAAAAATEAQRMCRKRRVLVDTDADACAAQGGSVPSPEHAPVFIEAEEERGDTLHGMSVSSKHLVSDVESPCRAADHVECDDEEESSPSPPPRRVADHIEWDDDGEDDGEEDAPPRKRQYIPAGYESVDSTPPRTRPLMHMLEQPPRPATLYNASVGDVDRGAECMLCASMGAVCKFHPPERCDYLRVVGKTRREKWIKVLCDLAGGMPVDSRCLQLAVSTTGAAAADEHTIDSIDGLFEDQIQEMVVTMALGERQLRMVTSSFSSRVGISAQTDARIAREIDMLLGELPWSRARDHPQVLRLLEIRARVTGGDRAAAAAAAAEHARRALRVFGPESMQAARAGVLYMAVGKCTLEEGIAIVLSAERVLGAWQFDAQRARARLVDMYLDADDLDQAESAISSIVYGRTRTIHAVDAVLQVTKALMRAHRYGRALELAKHAVRMAAETVGVHSSRNLYAARMCVAACALAGEDIATTPVGRDLQELIDTYARVLGPAHVDTLRTMLVVVAHEIAMGSTHHWPTAVLLECAERDPTGTVGALAECMLPSNRAPASDEVHRRAAASGIRDTTILKNRRRLAGWVLVHLGWGSGNV